MTLNEWILDKRNTIDGDTWITIFTEDCLHNYLYLYDGVLKNLLLKANWYSSIEKASLGKIWCLYGKREILSESKISKYALQITISGREFQPDQKFDFYIGYSGDVSGIVTLTWDQAVLIGRVTDPDNWANVSKSYYAGEHGSFWIDFETAEPVKE